MLATIMMSIGVVGNIYSTFVLSWAHMVWVQKVTWVCSSLVLNIIFVIMFAALFNDMNKRVKAAETITDKDAEALLKQYIGDVNEKTTSNNATKKG